MPVSLAHLEITLKLKLTVENAIDGQTQVRKPPQRQCFVQTSSESDSNLPSTVEQGQCEPKDLLKLLLKLVDGCTSIVCPTVTATINF
jgi:hypothetical protein